MKHDMTKPCAECPFALPDGFHLGAARRAEIAYSLTRDASFPCHMTLDYDNDDSEDGDGRYTPETQHCAGAMALLEREDRPNQAMRIAERLGMYSGRDALLELELPYRSLWDWVGYARSR